jgi:hypothetical protein
LSIFDIPEQDYNNSFKELLNEPSAIEIMQKIDYDVREKYEPVLPLKNREEVKSIYCEQLQMEADSYVEMYLMSSKAAHPAQF